MAASAATPGMTCSRPSVLPPVAGLVESLEQAATTLTAERSQNDRDLMRSSRVRGGLFNLLKPLPGGWRHHDQRGGSKGSESLEFEISVLPSSQNSSDSDPCDSPLIGGSPRNATGPWPVGRDQAPDPAPRCHTSSTAPRGPARAPSCRPSPGRHRSSQWAIPESDCAPVFAGLSRSPAMGPLAMPDRSLVGA